MKKLIKGIIDFRKNVRPNFKETFAKLALGQSPDTLFIACSDSRVAPNVFASTDPGDMFVIRNVGNLIPQCGGDHGLSVTDRSEAAAIEFAVQNLGISDIIICGHSECGAMQALINDIDNVKTPNLKSWLVHGQHALARLETQKNFASQLEPHNRLSQLNVLLQIDNLKSYPIIKEKIANKKLRIHGWWFDLKQALVLSYDELQNKFLEIDDEVAKNLLDNLSVKQ